MFGTQASVSDLNKELDRARSISQSQARSGPGGNQVGPTDVLRELLSTLPGGMGGEMSRELDTVERIRAGPQQGGKPPEAMSPQELHGVLWQVLTFRDSGRFEPLPSFFFLDAKLMVDDYAEFQS